MITLGADPEFFLKIGDKNVSAHSIVPGTKRDPHPLGSGHVQLDGTAVEFNVKPARDKDEFSSNISSVLSELRTFIDSKYLFHFAPTVTYDKGYFETVPETCKELGCDPDFNAYDGGKENKKPDTKGSSFRTGAGHLHVGWTSDVDTSDKSHLWDCCQLVQALDGFFQPYEKIWDTDTKRRSLYGKPGAFRPKHYGVEYRVLSNAWLNYPKMWPWLFEASEFVFKQTVEGKGTKPYVPSYYSKDIKRVNEFVRNSLGSEAPLLKLDYLEN